MKELNELVELAKKATSGEWNAFILNGGDGTFSIHTPDDSRKGDVVNWPGFDTANCSKTQKKANAKYIAAANPATILAIAEAFRALEQRAEAAEAKMAAIHGAAVPAVWASARSIETKRKISAFTDENSAIAYGQDNNWSDIIALFTRPAPPVVVGDLVMLIRRLVHALKKASPDNKLPSQVSDYMRRNGHFKISDCLRADKSADGEG